jgi:cytochrome c biogenesis protein CcdA/thiol-disulfide isomerase/thioredoxin
MMAATTPWQWPVASLAGIATVASPCVLPVLPLLLGVSAQDGGRTRPLFIILGFVLSFTGLALLFSASTRVLGLSPDAVRWIAAAGMLCAGVMMLWPQLGERAMAPMGRVANIGHRWSGLAGAGPLGGMLLGASLGALWTPCAGPVLATILALVAGQSSVSETAPLLLAYAAGAGLPMLAIAYGGQLITRQVRAFTRHAERFRRVCGLMVVASAMTLGLQLDAHASAWVDRVWSGLTRTASTPAAPLAADTAQAAPEFTGIDQWLNSPPLSLKALRGQVVLVEFWTYACSNCVNTLPHIQQWHERYAGKGLRVVGVHTPEFAFERSPDNVRQAIRRHGLSYPVALDNQYKTWNAYANQYWPALYLIDRQGRIVFTHFGEGDEDRIEQRVQQALAQP